MNLLSLTFSATFCNGWPRLKFYIDDNLCHECKIDLENVTVNLPIDLIESDHTLIIELLSKNKFNTILKDNVIVQDQLVTLESMHVDDIQLPDFFKYSGTFNNGQNIKSPCLTWGQNGKWVFDFKTPLITWVLVEISKEEKKYFSQKRLGDDFGNETVAFDEINKIIKNLNY
jgi:hypothetical protein